MTDDEAKRVIATLRTRRVFEISNSMYGKWSFAFDDQRQQFHYHSEFWGDDPENPRVEDEWLTESELGARLAADHGFEPNFANFVGERYGER